MIQYLFVFFFVITHVGFSFLLVSLFIIVHVCFLTPYVLLSLSFHTLLCFLISVDYSHHLISDLLMIVLLAYPIAYIIVQSIVSVEEGGVSVNRWCSMTLTHLFIFFSFFFLSCGLDLVLVIFSFLSCWWSIFLWSRWDIMDRYYVISWRHDIAFMIFYISWSIYSVVFLFCSQSICFCFSVCSLLLLLFFFIDYHHHLHHLIIPQGIVGFYHVRFLFPHQSIQSQSSLHCGGGGHHCH